MFANAPFFFSRQLLLKLVRVGQAPSTCHMYRVERGRSGSHRHRVKGCPFGGTSRQEASEETLKSVALSLNNPPGMLISSGWIWRLHGRNPHGPFSEWPTIRSECGFLV